MEMEKWGVGGGGGSIPLHLLPSSSAYPLFASIFGIHLSIKTTIHNQHTHTMLTHTRGGGEGHKQSMLLQLVAAVLAADQAM